MTSRMVEAAREFFLSCTAFNGLSIEDQNRIRSAFQAGDIFEARSEGRLLAFNDADFLKDASETESNTLSSDDILDAWDEQEAIKLFTLSGPFGRMVLPGGASDDALRSALGAPTTPDGKACWFRMLCLRCALGLPADMAGRSLEAS